VPKAPDIGSAVESLNALFAEIGTLTDAVNKTVPQLSKQIADTSDRLQNLS
jgi:ABC-type transporter Mla subunit MlaD